MGAPGRSRVSTGSATLSVSSSETRLFAAAAGHVAFTNSRACDFGYHSAYSTPHGIQTYAVATFDNTFPELVPNTGNITALSHEVAEWQDDPYLTNPAPAWGAGQISGCSGAFEVGDPLTGTTFADSVGGYTYYPQELAFFSWFYHQSPSLGVKGWYSDQGKFTNFAAACLTATRAPLPANAATSPGVNVNSVACPATSSCVAAGDYSDSTGNLEGLLLTGSGTSWTATEAPLPANAAPSQFATLNSVACPATSSCVAAGTYNDSSGHEAGVLLTGSGKSWTATEAPLPANAAASPVVIFTALACPATSSCVATGYYTDSAGNYEGLLLAGSGTSWTATEAPLPANAAASPSVFMSAVACPATSSCVATGNYRDASGNFDGLMLTGSGSSWTATEAPLPANAGPSQFVMLNSVTCAATSSCVAAGSYTDSSGSGQGLLLTGAATSWTATEAPLPAHAAINPDGSVISVACPAATSCIATGGYTDTSGHGLGMLLAGSGTSWTAAEAPIPPDAAASPAPQGSPTLLGDIACSSATSCVATGAYADTSGHGQGMLLTGTAATVPLPANAAANPLVALLAVACPPATPCTAVGWYSDRSGTTQGLLISGPAPH